MPEAPRAALVCRAGRPFACRLSLPLWCPKGWRARQVAGAAGVGGAQRGGVLSLSPAYPAFGLLCCPHPPSPLPSGKGEFQSLFRRGLRPRHPCTEPSTALIVPAKQVSGATGSLRFGAKPIEHAFLWAVPVAKERGDRGRWNYPSHATAAFEMVLSPGAGRASAVGGTPPLGHAPGKNSPPRSEKSRNPIDFCPAAWYHIYKDSPDNLHEYIAEAPKKKGRNDNALSKKTVS